MRKKHGLRPHEQRARDQATSAGMQTAPKQEEEPKAKAAKKSGGKRQGKR